MKARAFSLELLLVCLLPVLAVIGCAITLWLALSLPAHEVAAVDRFGHAIGREIGREIDQGQHPQ